MSYQEDMQRYQMYRENHALKQGFQENIRVDFPIQLKVICLFIITDTIIYFLTLLKISLPKLFLAYMASIFIINILAVIGIITLRSYGRYFAILSALIQLIFRLILVLFYFQSNKLFDLLLGILISFFIIFYFSEKSVKALFS